MSNFTTYGRQDLYETQLASAITSSATSLTVVTAPSFTLSSGSFYAVIDENGTPEIVEVTAISGTTWTVTRGIAKYEGGGSTAAAHAGGVSVVISHNWKTFSDIATSLDSKVDNTGDTMSGVLQWSGTTHAGIKLLSLTTAQRDALTAANGNIIYNTSTGEFNVYQGGAWSAVASGSTQPDGSTTVAGKFEEATVAEQGTATATGGTGARLIPANANLVKTSSGAGDENKIAILDAAGKFAEGFMTYDATEAEIDQVCYGVTATSTAANLNALTNKSNVLLHEHILNLTQYRQMAESSAAVPRTGATVTLMGASLADTANEEATTFGCFFRPTGYNISTVKVDIYIPLTEAGDLYLEYRGTSFTPSADATTTTNTVTIAAVAVSTAGSDRIVTLTIPSTAYTNWDAGDRIAFTVRRDASNAADTIEQNIQVLGIEVVYVLA